MLKICLTLNVISVALAHSILTRTFNEIPKNVSQFQKVGSGNKYLFLGEEVVSWYAAYLNCRKLGANLASFETIDEWRELNDFLGTFFPSYWWVAASDMETEGDFFWYTTGERLNYVNWYTGQPNNEDGLEDCVLLWIHDEQYQMGAFNCSDEIAQYICQMEKPINLLFIAN